MLPAFTVAAATASSPEPRQKAIVAWTAFAAVAHWLSLGALLVLPACCVVLAISVRRHPDTFRLLAAAAVVLMASVSVHYVLGIRHAQGSASLQEFWSFALPPTDAGVWDRVQWMYGRLAPFASKPGGSVLAVVVWCLACIGFARASNRVLGATAGLVVASGFVLGALGLMPLYERLSLWFVPALYLGHCPCRRSRGVVVPREAAEPCVDESSDCRRDCRRRAGCLCRCRRTRNPTTFAAVVPPTAITRPTTEPRSHGSWRSARLERRSSPRKIRCRRSGGTEAHRLHNRTAAISPMAGGFSSPSITRHGVICRGREPDKVVDGRSRVHVYLGFPDMPPGFDDLLLERVSKRRHDHRRTALRRVQPCRNGRSSVQDGVEFFLGGRGQGRRVRRRDVLRSTQDRRGDRAHVL